VAVQTPNCLAYPVAAFGVFKAGCVLVNTNPLYTPAEMEHQFNDAGIEALVIVDMFANKMAQFLARSTIKQVIVAQVPQFFSAIPRGVIRLVMKYWNKVLPEIVVPHVRFDAALTLGAAIMLTRKIDVAAYTRGLGLDTLAALMYIQNLQRAFDNYPITWISGVNTLFNALLNEEWFTAFPPRSLKASVAGGAALQHVIAQRWQRVTGTMISEGYGLTESSPVVSFNPMTGSQRPDSIGIPVPGTDVRLVDNEGQVVPVGEAGELIVRGPQVMPGYWNRPDETAKTLKDGWLYTGDIAVMDGDGFFRIVDRKKDMILVSGFNVYPNEVEDVIAAMDEVLEVGVIGVPDEHSGEAVRAYIVLITAGLTEEAVREHCRKSLAAYKVPKTIVFRSELPKTPIGKILRKDLRAEYKLKNAA